MLDEIEVRVLAPLDVVEDADQRTFGGNPFEQAPERPRDLLAGARDGLVAEKRPDRICAVFVERGRRQLLRDFDNRPVGDALAVREATPSHDERVGAFREKFECQA